MVFKGLLEEILLNESATPEQVCKAIGNHSYVIINYHTEGEDNNTGSRIIMPVAYGKTSSSNPVIRAFEPYGDTTTSTPEWKYFRLDRISYWEETPTRFYRKDLPRKASLQFNRHGDNLMKEVEYMINFNSKVNATNGINNGPKTKEKIRTTKYYRTQGDKDLDNNLAKRNLFNQEHGIRIDVDNNAKANNSFNMYTNNTPMSTGPRTPQDKSYKPISVSGTPEKSDIDSNELNKLRAQVQTQNPSDYWNDNNNYSTYHNEISDDIWAQAEKDMEQYNKDHQYDDYSKYQQNHWQDSVDSMMKHRKDSDNRVLMDMEDEED